VVNLASDDGADSAGSAARRIRSAILAALPERLLGGHDASELHPFEDASLVFYDDTTAFYDVHHDSWYKGKQRTKLLGDG
jgi:hypothetical protein